jgi:predicted acetyltransferase
LSITVRACGSVEELRQALNAISHYVAFENTEEDAERFAQWLKVDRVHAAWEGDSIVGGAGVFEFELSVPGGESIPSSGVTVVGVYPTHRRRGVLTQLMRTQLADCRERGELAAWLWASEATIYPRFGYALASRLASITLARERTAFAQPFEPRGTFRLLELEDAATHFPPVYEQARKQRPGMFSRSRAWWETRRLFDDPARRRSGGPLNRVLLELDGKSAGYALYQVTQDWAGGSSKGVVRIREAVAPSPEATRELWRWLLDFDWTSQFVADLPLDHPLFMLLAEPRRMGGTINDGVWVRLLDIEQALSARSYNGDGEVVLEVTDRFIPELAGRYRVTAGGTGRTEASPDIALDITGLGSVYLGEFTFADLVRSSRAEELTKAAVTRADALFVTDTKPWCVEIF